MTTVRLTVGQAIVRFMAEQYVERDTVQPRFIAGVWGIIGHGNVAGLGQALLIVWGSGRIRPAVSHVNRAGLDSRQLRQGMPRVTAIARPSP